MGKMQQIDTALEIQGAPSWESRAAQVRQTIQEVSRDAAELLRTYGYTSSSVQFLPTTEEDLSDNIILGRYVYAAQQGDMEAWGLVCSHVYPMVFAICMKMLRNTETANDLTQNVLIHSQKKLPGLHDPACFGGWIRKIAHRMCINFIVRQKKMINSEGHVDMLVDTVTPEQKVQTKEKKQLMLAAVQRLMSTSSKHYNVMYAFYWQRKSVKEIAKECGRPLGTVKRYLYEARNALRELIEEQIDIDDFL